MIVASMVLISLMLVVWTLFKPIVLADDTKVFFAGIQRYDTRNPFDHRPPDGLTVFRSWNFFDGPGINIGFGGLHYVMRCYLKGRE